MSKLLAPASSPATTRLRLRVPLPQVDACVAVKQALPPQGPLAPVILAAVSRLRASVPLISTRRIEVSSS